MIDPLKLKKDEIHKKIDDNINNIVKHMGNIFESIRFNDQQLIEEANSLEVLSSTESVAQRLQELVRIVYDIKVDFLKKNENKKKINKDASNLAGMINNKVIQLQECYNFINSQLKEMKNNKYYKYSLNFNFD